MSEAAKARAELAALTKNIDGLSKSIALNAGKAATAQNTLTTSIHDETRAMKTATSAAEKYNRYVLFAGRQSMDQHLADLEKQTRLLRLLNIQRQRGFLTPQADYTFRQREHQQMLLWNRAVQQGYATPDQYLTFLQKERTLFAAQTQAWRARDLAIRAATDAAVSFADKVSGRKISATGIENTSQSVNDLNNALTGLPDTVTTKVSLDAGKAKADAAFYSDLLGSIPDTINTLASFDASDALSDVKTYTAALKAIPDMVVTRARFIGGSGVSGVENLTQKVTLIPGKSNWDATKRLPNLNENVNITGTPAATQDLLNVAQAARTVAAQSHVAQSAVNSLAGKGGAGGGGLAGLAAAAAAAGGGGGRGWGWLAGIGGWFGGGARGVNLFGGAFARFLPKWLVFATAGHLAVEAVIEFAAVIIPAVVALGAFAVAAADASRDIVKNMQNIVTVSQATGKNLYPLTGAFQKVSDAVRPKVFQLFGDLLTIVNSKMGVLKQLAVGTGSALDRLGARTTAAIVSGGMQVFLKNAVTDVAKLGTVVGNIFGIIGNLLRTVPGYAAKLLDVLVAVTKGVENLTGSGFVQGAIKGLLAFHGAILYAGLGVTLLARTARAGLGLVSRLAMGAAQAVSNLGMRFGFPEGKMNNLGKAATGTATRMERFSKSMASVAKSGALPWFALVAAAVAFLGYKFLTTKDATDQFIASVNANLARAPLFALMPTLALDLQQVQARTALVSAQFHQMGAISQVLGQKFQVLGPGLTKMTGGWIGSTQRFINRWTSLDGLFGSSRKTVLASAAAVTDSAHAFDSLNKETQNLYISQALARERISAVAKVYKTDYAGAISLASVAGLKATDITNHSNQAWQQSMIMIQGVVQGYKAMGQQAGTLGRDLDALTFAGSDQLAAMTKLNAAWDTFTSTVAAPRSTFITLAQSMNTFNTDAKLAGARASGLGAGFQHMTKGLSANSLTLQADFQATYTNANAMLDALRSAGVPAGVFTKVVKNMVAALIPMAGHSKAARAEISSLAQEANGPASGGLRALQQWAGKVKNPMVAMQHATDLATIALHNLTKDARDAANIIHTQLIANTVAYASKLFDLAGKQKIYLADLAKYGPNSRITLKALSNLTKAQQDATTWVQKATMAQDKAATALNRYQQAIDKGKNARAALIADLHKQGANAKNAGTDVSTYTDLLLTNQRNTDKGKAARKKLIDDLIAAGADSKTAKELVDKYTRTIQANATATDRAKAARAQIIKDLIDAGKWSRRTHDDLGKYTNFVTENKVKTDAGRAARQKLIDDLIKSGVHARTARQLVDELTNSIHRIPDHKSTSFHFGGQGQWVVGASPLTKAGKAAQPVLIHPAAGGFISPGGRLVQGGHIDQTSGEQNVDSVHAVLTPGEYVVKKSAVRRYGRPLMEALNQQKLAAGGYVDPVRGANVTGERVDMGVDFGGSGPVRALGPGVITNTYNSGWPGGAFIGERLSGGPDAGRYVYYAENIAPNVRVGQRVNAGQVVGFLSGQMETGWAAPPGTGETMAASFGQQAHSGDPGAVATAFGVAFNNLLKSLGGPSGIVSGSVSGKVPRGWGGGGASCAPVKPVQVRPVIGHISTSSPPRMGKFIEHEYENTVASVEQQVANDIAARIATLECNAMSASGPGPGGGRPGANAALARQLMPAWGSGAEWNAWNALEMAEAGWNQFARNPSSGAYGIPQALPPSKMGAAANPPQSNPTAQIRWMINYIKSTYGDPIRAEQHEQAFHWYGQGGPVGLWTGGDVLKGVKDATANKGVQESMLLGSYLESRWNPQAVGDHGTSFGPYQIHLPAHPGMTRRKAEDPYTAAKFMLGAYRAGVNRSGTSHQPQDAEHAAFLAERPARDYYKTEGAGTVNTGWRKTLAALGIHGKPKPSHPGSTNKPLPPGSILDQAQKWMKAAAAMRGAMSAEESAEKALVHRPWPGTRAHGRGKHHVKASSPFSGALKILGTRQRSVQGAEGKIDFSSPNTVTEPEWWNAIGTATNFESWLRKGWVQNLKKKHPDSFSTLQRANINLVSKEKAAHTAWNALYGKQGLHPYPATPKPQLKGPGGTIIPTPDISALLPISPVAAPFFRSGGYVQGFDRGGVVAPAEPARSLGDAAKAVAGGGEKVGLQINGGITVNNPKPEMAGDSITRNVQRLSFLAGRGAV